MILYALVRRRAVQTAFAFCAFFILGNVSLQAQDSPTPSDENAPSRENGKLTLAATELPAVLGERLDEKPGDEWTNQLGMKFRRIGAGKFLMGSPETEVGRERWGSDETLREVELTQDYYVGVYEVTQLEWFFVENENPSFYCRGDFPVHGVSWSDAQRFLEKMNQGEFRAELVQAFGDGARYDLPTEAQWEYACRAGTTTAYSFGAALNGDAANVVGQKPYGDLPPGKTEGKPIKVGSYEPNAWGLYDMCGNVWEWRVDFYAPYDPNDLIDPVNYKMGTFHVCRGGSWRYDAWSARAANRVNDSYKIDSATLGLRLIVVLGQKEPITNLIRLEKAPKTVQLKE